MRQALVLLLLTVGGSALAGAQISPGPLAAPHAGLDGPLQCTKCHAGGRGNKSQMSGLCLDCHKEIAWLSERDRGVHGRVKDQPCASCHPEHAGRSFALISWEGRGGAAERFDHTAAGWPLEGSHARAQCSACHKAAFRVSPAARLAPPAPAPRQTWVGLETRCTGCHSDVHRGALDRNCLKCHDVERWKPAPRFDHARTAYPLTGAHETVKCADCHADPRLQLARDAAGNAIPRFKPLEFRECSACHADPHRGRLGTGCAKCHETASFKTIKRASFDHDRTRYPLRGRHASVRCEQCHDFTAGRVARNPPFATCNGCHTPDPHAGAATLAGQTVDCASCHVVDGWRPSTYTVAQHARTRYALEAKHATARCAGCHTRTTGGSGGVVVMRPVTTSCVSCHVDPHAGKLARCTDCHDLRGFRPSTIDVVAHRRYRFPLDGAHRAVPCVGCHETMRRPAAATTLATAKWTGPAVLFGVARTGCAGCHTTPHGAQFASRRDGGACESCHDTDAFRPARRFDHNRDAAFSLKGAHTGVPCERCHRTTQAAGAKPVVVYRPVPTACEACHR